MKNDSLVEYAREKIPDEFRSYLNEKNNMQCASFISHTQDELRTMKAHKENTKFTELKVKGLDELIIALENFDKENVSVINIRTKSYSFKVYSDEKNNFLLGVVILKLKKKSDEDIRFGREVLGIVTPPPGIEDD